jgi:hypothetical protein
LRHRAGADRVFQQGQLTLQRIGLGWIRFDKGERHGS